MNTFLEELRKKNELSQAELSEKLCISRPTLQKILQGKKELSLSQVKILSSIFEISIQSIIEEKIQPERSIHLETANTIEQIETRISIPQEQVEKFKNTLLYITQKIGALPNVGQTVLYKLLYFCDFDYYEKFEEQLIGARYIKNHFGPTPIAFKKIVENMVEEGKIEEVKTKYFKHEQTKYLPVQAPNLRLFSAQEIQHIDEVLSRLAHKNANELSNLSHQDTPWITAEEGKEISYEAVFYRTPETSVRTYDDTLQKHATV